MFKKLFFLVAMMFTTSSFAATYNWYFESADDNISISQRGIDTHVFNILTPGMFTVKIGSTITNFNFATPGSMDMDFAGRYKFSASFVSAVSETAQFAMLLAGLAAVGFVATRRRNKITNLSA